MMSNLKTKEQQPWDKITSHHRQVMFWYSLHKTSCLSLWFTMAQGPTPMAMRTLAPSSLSLVGCWAWLAAASAAAFDEARKGQLRLGRCFHWPSALPNFWKGAQCDFSKVLRDFGSILVWWVHWKHFSRRRRRMMTMTLRRTRTCPRTCPGLETGPAQEVFLWWVQWVQLSEWGHPWLMFLECRDLCNRLVILVIFGYGETEWTIGWWELGQLEALGRSTSHAATLDQTAVQNGGRRVPWFFFRHSITSYYYPFVTKKLRNQVTQQISTSDTACNCCCEAFLSPKWPRGGGIFPLFSMLGEDPFGKQSGLPCAKHVMTSEDILRHRH